MDAVHDWLLALGAVVGLGILTVFCVWVWAKVQPLPPTTPALPPRRRPAEADALLAFPTWRKRAPGAANAVPYERPLDVMGGAPNVPDDGLLPPPREVLGRNGEA